MTTIQPAHAVAVRGSGGVPRNTILLGDALQLLATLPRGVIDLTVFSPPYDGIRDYGKDWSLDYKTLGSELFDATTDGGVCAVVIGDGTRNFAKSGTTFRWAVDWMDRVGWRLFECCIYQRHGNPGAWWTQRFRVDHEYILIFFRGDRPRHFDKSTLMVPSRHAETCRAANRCPRDNTLPVGAFQVARTPFHVRTQVSLARQVDLDPVHHSRGGRRATPCAGRRGRSVLDRGQLHSRLENRGRGKRYRR